MFLSEEESYSYGSTIYMTWENSNPKSWMHIAIYITIFIILIISNNTQALLKFLQPANSYYFLTGIPYTNVSHISVMSS